MLLKNKNIAVIGAGPVGLIMANLLQQKGGKVTVYERDKGSDARIWGGTLDLHEGTGQAALKKAGLLDSYFAMAKPLGRTVADEQGNVLFTVQPQYETPEINRNDLRKIMLESLKGGTVVWDRKFTELEESDGKWLLHFENGTDATVDIVIGANGGLSSARGYVTDAVIENTGTFIIQGEVYQPEINCAEFYKLCNNGILMTAGEGHTFVANPDNKGALTYNVTFNKPEGWDSDGGLNFRATGSISTFLLNMFSGWHECYKQVFRSTSSFVGLPSRKIPLDKPWKANRNFPITLIGDAAHLMPPFAGQGVNIGLMDALILSENLTNGEFESIHAAINNYEHRMLVYAREAQQETGKNEIAMHSPGFSFGERFNK